MRNSNLPHPKRDYRWSSIGKVLILIFSILCFINGGRGQLTSSISVASTNVDELTVFTVTMHMTNTGSIKIPDVQPSTLQVGGTSWAVLTKWPSPAFEAIAPGKTAKFSLLYRAMLAGNITFSGNAVSSIANSTVNSSPVINVMPKTVSNTATTDASGNALLKVGSRTIPIHLVDEYTGSPLAGIVLAIAQDKKNQGRAVLVMADKLERYPVQIAILHGPIVTNSASVQNNLTTVPSPPIPVKVPVRSSQEVVFSGVFQALQTGLLPNFIESASDNPDFPPVILSALKALTSAKGLLLPPPLTGIIPSVTSTETLPADQMISVLNQQAIDAGPGAAVQGILVFGAKYSLLDEFEIGLDLNQELFSVTTASAYQALGYTDLTLMQIRSGGLLIEMVVPANASQVPVVNLPTGDLQVSVDDSNGNPISGGSLELISPDTLGLGLSEVLDTGGSADIPVPLGDYNALVYAPGYLPYTNEVFIPDSGTNITITLASQPIASGTLSQDQSDLDLGFLPPGTTFTVSPHFYDGNGNEVGCTGTNTPQFSVQNPVGEKVATVDPNTGVVTMLDGCGAARITAWCSGVETAPLLVSSDCNGTEPPTSKRVFEVAPTSLTFTAMENGNNPPDQTVYLIPLEYNAGSVNIDLNRSWMNFGADGSDYDEYGVNISGLAAGTYTGDITYTDTTNSSDFEKVKVTLVIKPQPPAAVAGTWRGTYSYPIDDVGDEAEFNVVWVLNQSGHNVSGAYGEIEYGSTQQVNGSLNDGHVSGNSFSIFDDGGLEYVGTVGGGGTTISGSVYTGSLPGSFSVTKQ